MVIKCAKLLTIATTRLGETVFRIDVVSVLLFQGFTREGIGAWFTCKRLGFTTKNTLKYLKTYLVNLHNQSKYLEFLKKALIGCS